MSIQIVVPVYNRKKITELSLQQTFKYKGDGNKLVVYNDHSTEYDNDFLAPYCDEVIKLPKKLGVQHLRWYQLREFLKTDFEYLYLTDNDVIHDPLYISKMMELYSKYMLKNGQKLPVCLYNTIYHMQVGNIIMENSDISMRRTAPGVSMFFDRKMVEKGVELLNNLSSGDPVYAWDYIFLELLGLPWITSKISYLDHWGSSGLHSPDGLIGMEKDKAINPTEYLKSIRKPVIDYVLFNGEKPILL